MRIRIISVPYDMGRRLEGSGRGPRVLLDAGLVSSLREHGHDVGSTDVVLEDGGALAEVLAAFRLASLVRGEVERAMLEKELPIVLSGNCLISAGAISGLLKEETEVLWFDAHADLNTPETTESGYVDGMALSIACGSCWSTLAARNGLKPIDAGKVVLVGARDLDRGERETLSKSAVRVLDVDEVAGPSLETLLSGGSGGLYLHVDADVLDTSVGTANRFAAPGGLDEGGMLAALSTIASARTVEGLGVTAFDPDHDRDGRMVSALGRIIVHLVDAVEQHRAAGPGPVGR
jgi:arginase